MEQPPLRRSIGPKAVGPDVKALQARLNARADLSPRLTLDGVFGDKTRKEVERFQRAEGLTASGMIFELDWLRLMRSRRGPPAHAARGLARSMVVEAGLEERLARVFGRPLPGNAGTQLRRRFVGDDDALAHLADACESVAGAATALERRDPPSGLGELALRDFRSMLNDFSRLVALARSEGHLDGAALVLGDILELVDATWFFGVIPRKKAAYIPVSEAEPEKERKAESPPVRRAAVQAPESDPGNVDQDAQAATLVAAAKDGAPFCEECEKARQRDKAAAA